MKVFVSWSGELSKHLATEFRLWLPGALQMVRPYFTPSDIEKGSRWPTEISKELEESDLGVLFITRENINSSWIAYEAGALSKRLDKSKVCPLIFSLDPEDLPGPLRQFQATQFKKDDYRALLRTVNSTAGDAKLQDKVLDEVFEMWWPRLEERFNEIIGSNSVGNEQKPIREERDILEEILALVRITSERNMMNAEVHPGAVREMARALIAANHVVKNGLGEQEALFALSEMVKPLEHIIKRVDRRPGSANLREILDEVNALTFTYDAQEENDIPF